MNERDYRFDNIKGIMIILVVFCHLIEKFQIGYLGIGLTKHIYYAVYSFHMPVFVFISGYFAGKNRDGQLSKNLKRYLIPYVVINTVYDVMDSVSKKSLSFDPFYPHWILWFLLSLFFWQTFADYAKNLRVPVVLTVLIALVAGVFGEIGRFLSLSRTICFFPFFIAGYCLRTKQSVFELKTQMRPILCALFVLAQTVVAVMASKSVIIDTFYLAESYRSIGQIPLPGALFRFGVYAFGFIGIMFFLSVMPNTKTILSIIGRYSITIYIAHQFIIVIAQKFFVGFDSPAITIPTAFILSVVICYVFGNKYVDRLYQTIFGRIGDFLVPSD